MPIEINEGLYRVRAVSQGFQTNDKGNHLFALLVEVFAMVHPDGDVSISPPKRRTMRYYLSKDNGAVKNEKSILKLISDVAAIGKPVTSFQHLDPRAQQHVDLTGVEFEAECTHDDYQGRSYENWRIPSVEYALPNQADSKFLRELDALFAKQLAAAKGNGKPAAPPPPQRVAPAPRPSAPPPNPQYLDSPATDDDLLF